MNLMLSNQGRNASNIPHNRNRKHSLEKGRHQGISSFSQSILNIMNSKKSIDLLNKAVADELQAVHQYMYWHFHLDDQGFAPLAGMFKRIAIMEMGHVERLADRILFLKGDVVMEVAGPVEKITEAQKILSKAAEMEQAGVTSYNQFALQCSQNADAVSKQLFEALVNDEESHFDEFDKQLENIKRFGPNYLALQSFNKAPEQPAEAD